MEYILDIGSGHNPSLKANLFLERYISNNFDRDGKNVIIKENMVVGDALYLPFKNKTISKITSNHCIEHTDSPKKFIEESNRVSNFVEITSPGLIHEIIRSILFEPMNEVHKWVYLPNGKWISIDEFQKARPTYTGKQNLWIKVMRTLPRKIRIGIFGVFSYILDEYCQNIGLSVVDFRYNSKGHYEVKI